MSQLLVLDTRDDRREVFTLLSKLSPRRRVAFIAHCCKQVSKPRRSCPVPQFDPALIDLAYRCDRADLRLTNAALMDFWALVAQWELDATASAVALERWVRQNGQLAKV